MLCTERNFAIARRPTKYREARQQLLTNELQLRTHSAALDGTKEARPHRRDPRSGQDEPTALRRTWFSDSSGVQPHDFTARSPTRQGNAGDLGYSRLRRALRAAARRHVVGRNGSRHSFSPSACRTGHSIHHSRSETSKTRAPEREPQLEKRFWRPDRSEQGLPCATAIEKNDCGVFL